MFLRNRCRSGGQGRSSPILPAIRPMGKPRVVRFSFGLKGSLIVRLGFTQHPLAIPFDASFKRVDGTVRANLSFLAVALHQLERAVAPSHREAKVICVQPDPSLPCH